MDLKVSLAFERNGNYSLFPGRSLATWLSSVLHYPFHHVWRLVIVEAMAYGAKESGMLNKKNEVRLIFIERATQRNDMTAIMSDFKIDLKCQLPILYTEKS